MYERVVRTILRGSKVKTDRICGLIETSGVNERGKEKNGFVLEYYSGRSFSETDFIGLNSTRYNKQKERKNNLDEKHVTPTGLWNKTRKIKWCFFFSSRFTFHSYSRSSDNYHYSYSHDGKIQFEPFVKTILFLKRVTFKHVPGEIMY